MRLSAGVLIVAFIAMPFAPGMGHGLAFAQQNGAVIAGRVLDQNGAPVVKAQVAGLVVTGKRQAGETILPPLFEKGCVPSLVEKAKWRNLLLTQADRR